MSLVKVILLLGLLGFGAVAILQIVYQHDFEKVDRGADRHKPLQHHHRHSLKHLLIQGYKDWEQFKLTHSKEYTDKHEEMERMLLFLSTQQLVQSHNDAFERGETTFQMGLNHFSDLTPEEYHKMNGFRLPTKEEDIEKINPSYFSQNDVPDSIDWREHGYVTPVKDQGKCGSCWAFSVTGVVEGQHMRVKNELISLSEQNLVDCARSFGTNGCKGGWMESAYDYIIANNGLDTEDSYPYRSSDGSEQTCSFDTGSVGATITSYNSLASGDEGALKDAVGTVGPVAVAINVRASFGMYSSGVYYDPECNTSELNHAVLVVGYGTDDSGNDYWLVKNSWRDTWGDGGYIKMARNRDNNCGIASRASYPVV